MDTVMDRSVMENTIVEQEARLHNALIKERYRKLQSAEADQFAQEAHTTQARESNYGVRAFVLEPEKSAFTAPVVDNTPVVEQVPQVTEFVRTYNESPVFTTEKFNAVKEDVKAYAPVASMPVEIPLQQQTPAKAVALSTEAQYSLSAFAKTVIAAFAALVVVMLTLICVNTQIIQNKTAQVHALETQRQELLDIQAEIEQRIVKAKSKETIREYAESQGMIESGK